MNPLRFRDKLKQWRKDGIIKHQTLATILDAPVFVFGVIESLANMEIEWCEQHVLDDTKRVPKSLPFPVFSVLYGVQSYEAEGIKDCALTVWGTPYTIERTHDFDTRADTGETKVKLGLWGSMKVEGHECVFLAGFTGEQSRGMCINVFQDGIESTKHVMSTKAAADAAADIAHGMRSVMLRAVFDIMNPSNVVMSVTPKQTGRSVQWVKAHTHYCIINKAHATRCQRDKRGPTDVEIERGAHWRRAHMRRLMSDKFTHKKGQLVFVKHTWVGPTEWEGLDNKVYKVVNIPTP
jgi:hypothetical protein